MSSAQRERLVAELETIVNRALLLPREKETLRETIMELKKASEAQGAEPPATPESRNTEVFVLRAIAAGSANGMQLLCPNGSIPADRVIKLCREGIDTLMQLASDTGYAAGMTPPKVVELLRFDGSQD